MITNQTQQQQQQQPVTIQDIFNQVRTVLLQDIGSALLNAQDSLTAKVDRTLSQAFNSLSNINSIPNQAPIPNRQTPEEINKSLGIPVSGPVDASIEAPKKRGRKAKE